MGDDTSSMTGTSSVVSNGDYMRGLDNEVEILYYAAGSTLVKAGEVNAGEFITIVPIVLSIHPGMQVCSTLSKDFWTFCCLENRGTMTRNTRNFRIP